MANQFLANTLAGLSQGLMAAGSGGWNNFAPGFNQGLMGAQQYQYDKLDREERRRLRELQEQQLQMQVEQQRTANQDAVAQKQAWEKYIGQGMMSPNGMSQAQFGGAPHNQMAPGLMQQFTPEQLSFLKTLPPEQGMSIVGQQMFKEADDSAPKTVGGMMWDQAQGKFVPIEGYTEQAAAIAAAGRPQGAGGGPEYGLQPFYITDPITKKTRAFQLSKDGGMQEIPIPEGFIPAPQTQYIDTGTAVVPMDKRTGGEVAEPVLKDVAGTKTQTELGEATGIAQSALPSVTSNSSRAIEQLAAIANDPAREAATGLSSVVTTKIPGSQSYGFKSRVDQSKSGAFLEAFNALKGGGAITEAEGQKATSALNRMDVALSEEDFMTALKDFEDVVKSGLKVAYKRANQPIPPEVQALIDAPSVTEKKKEDPLGIRP